jgi:hypothetical protein
MVLSGTQKRHDDRILGTVNLHLQAWGVRITTGTRLFVGSLPRSVSYHAESGT